MAKIKKQNKYGLINDEVKIILDTTFEEIESIFEDLIKIAIKINDKEKRYGYANRDGQIVIPCQFLEADNFSNGKAKVKKEYYIDKNGECIN